MPAAGKIEAGKIEPTSAPQATVITKKPSSTTNAAGLTDGDVVPSQYADGEKLQLSSPRLQDAPQASPRKSKPTSAANHAAVALGGARQVEHQGEAASSDLNALGREVVEIEGPCREDWLGCWLSRLEWG